MEIAERVKNLLYKGIRLVGDPKRGLVSCLLNRQLFYVLLITLLGVFLRLWWIIVIPNPPLSDFKTYYLLATDIFNGNSLYNTKLGWQGMGYPVALGFYFRLVGNTGVFTAKVFNVILSTGTLILFFLILRKLTDKKNVIYTAYMILAVLPNYIAYNNVLGTEVFVTFILAVIIALQVYNINHWLKYPLMGIFVGAAALTKPFFLAYPVVLASVKWLKTKSVKETVVLFITVFFFMAALVAPWTYRNYRKYGSFIPVSYNAGYVLYVNNNDVNSWGGWMSVKEIPPSNEFKKEIEKRGYSYGDIKPELETLYKNRAKQWIKNNPQEYLKLGFLRFNNTFFSGAADIEKWTMVKLKLTNVSDIRFFKVFMRLCDLVVGVLSVFGIVYTLLQLKRILKGLFGKRIKIDYLVSIPSLNITFFSAVFFALEGQPRYNFPVLIFLVIYTALCINLIRGEQRSLTA